MHAAAGHQSLITHQASYHPCHCDRLRHAFVGHTAEVVCVDVPATTGLAISGSADASVRVWDVSSGKALGSLQRGIAIETLSDCGVMSVASDMAGETVVSGDMSGHVQLHDIRARMLIASYPGHTEGVMSVAASQSTNIIASAGLDGSIRVWDTRHATVPMAVVTDHDGPIFAMSFSPSGAWLCSGGQDEHVRFTNVQQPQLSFVASGFGAPGLQFASYC